VVRLALLLESDDAGALESLRSAVADMLAGNRILELPTAAVYLAEAQWRGGDEDAADSAADIALEAARRQGSNHILLQALADFPNVLSRRLDAQREQTPNGTSSAAHCWLRETSRCQRRCARLWICASSAGARSWSMASSAVRRLPRRMSYSHFLRRDGLRKPSATSCWTHSFSSRTDKSARAYLRQSVHWLREILPDGALDVNGSRIELSETVVISSESCRFETQLGEAARLRGEARLTATLDALALYDQGPYLPGVRSMWQTSATPR